MYVYGDTIDVVDDISGAVELGTIVLVERDGDFPHLLHIYLKSENANNNDKIENKCEPYWKIITVTE